MQRRKFIKASLLTAGAFAVHTNIFARWLIDPWKVRMLTDRIGIFTEKGGTIAFFLSDEGNVVVDSEFPEQARHLISSLKERSHDPFRFLINTHHHGDHTSGNIEFKGMVQNVVGHSNCLANHKRVAEQQKNVDKQLFADTTFDSTWKYKIGGEKIKMHYFGAAHTDGDAIVHFQNANIAHVGDLVFNRRYAFVDRSAGANIGSWIEVLEKCRNTFDNGTQFIFGHAYNPENVVGNSNDLAAMQHYLSKLLRFVDQGIRAGKTKEEIISAKSIPGVTQWKGDSIERGLQAAYDELNTKI